MLKKLTILMLSLSLYIIPNCKSKIEKKPALKGRVIMHVGEVILKKANNQEKKLAVGDFVDEFDTILTKKNAMAVVQIGNKCVIRIQSETTVIMKELYSKNGCEIYLEKGEILSKVNKLIKGESYGVRTKTIIAAVRGTQFSTSYDGKTNILAVKEGKVVVRKNINDSISIYNALKEPDNKEKIIEAGKVAIAESYKDEKETKLAKIDVRDIKESESLTIEKISIVKAIPEIDKLNKEKIIAESKKQEKSYKKEELIIDKKLNKLIKKEKIEKLIKSKPKSLSQIKKVFNRIDEITLFNGRVIKGAIISRGSIYNIITTAGMKKIRGSQIRGVRVVK